MIKKKLNNSILKNVWFLAIAFLLSLSNVLAQGNTNCKSDFTFRIDQNSKTVKLVAQSRQQPAVHAFQLGDGTFLRGKEVKHTYDSAGVYRVCLKTIAFDSVTNQRCTTEVCKKITIVNCDRLTADFRYVVDGLTVKLAGMTNSNNVNTGFRFGDGQGIREDSAKHTYDKPGIYEICYIAEDYTYGCRKEVCKKIIVRDDNDCELRARFTVRQDGDLVKLKALSNQSPALYEWSFGDGDLAKGDEVRHQYDEPGVYRVCLRVTTRGKDSGELCKTTVCEKVVIRKPKCDLKADFVIAQDGLEVKLAARSNQDSVHHLWIFGDGEDATGKLAKHSYAKPGRYEIGLVVVDPVTKCKTCVWKTIIVEKPCRLRATIALRQDDEKVGLATRTNATRSAKYYWDLGDGTKTKGKYVQHTYAKKGVYIVTLTITDKKLGCKITEQIRVVVGPANKKAVMTSQSPKVAAPAVKDKLTPVWEAQVSPSPAKNVVAVSSKDKLLVNVKLYGSDGVLVKEQEGDLQSVDITLLPAGYYYAHVFAEDGSKSVIKFIKN